MLKRLYVVLLLLVTIPAIAQMRSAKTIFDVPAAKAQLDNVPMDSTGTVTATDTMSQDDHQSIAACSGASLKIGWLPVGDSGAAAQCFWTHEGTEVLKHAELTNAGGSTAMATEVLSDFAGPIRIAFSTAVASDDSDGDETTVTEDEQQTSANLLRANGGNVALSAAYPLYANPYPAGEFVAVTYGRVAGVFDALSGTGTGSQSLNWSELNANAEWAVTSETSLRTDNGVFNFEIYTNAGVIAGTKLFRTAVGADKSAFLHGEIGASLKLGSMATVGVSYNWFSADGIPGGATVLVGIGR